MKIINIPSLSIYHNTIAYYNKYVDKTNFDRKSINKFTNQIINEIKEMTLMMEQHSNIGEIPTNLYFMKPNESVICDITEDYENNCNDPQLLEELFNHTNNINNNNVITHDFRNTPNQYHISKYKNNNYLYQFGIDFILTSENEEYEDTYISSIVLPFLFNLDKDNGFTKDTNLINSIFSLKVFLIPKHIKLPKIETFFTTKHKDIIKFYNIPKNFIKNVLSYHNNKKHNKILSDDKLFELFDCVNIDKKRKKKKKNNKNETIEKMDKDVSNKLLDKCEEDNEDNEEDNEDNEEDNEDNEEVNENNEEVSNNKLLDKCNNKLLDKCKKKKIPFIITYQYKDIQTDRLIYEDLFTKLYYSNERFNQLIDLNNVKHIHIYKSFKKNYSNYTYFNGEMNNENHHFYIKNNKITNITKIMNLI